MSGESCVAGKRSAPHTTRLAEHRSVSPAAFAGSPRSGLERVAPPHEGACRVVGGVVTKTGRLSARVPPTY